MEGKPGDIVEIETTPEYWDCECQDNYVHPKTKKKCLRCGFTSDEMPDSRLIEVQMLGFEVTKTETIKSRLF